MLQKDAAGGDHGAAIKTGEHIGKVLDGAPNVLKDLSRVSVRAPSNSKSVVSG